MHYLALLTPLLAFISDPPKYVIRDTVDAIEVNQVIDKEGTASFRQFLFYDWDPIHQRLHVRGWRPQHSSILSVALDTRNQQQVLVFYDGAILRVVRTNTLQQSNTPFDPERTEKRIWPAADRIDLTPLR